jgi:hypothetical protein
MNLQDIYTIEQDNEETELEFFECWSGRFLADQRDRHQ